MLGSFVSGVPGPKYETAGSDLDLNVQSAPNALQLLGVKPIHVDELVFEIEKSRLV
jgi:hypothetical protein